MCATHGNYAHASILPRMHAIEKLGAGIGKLACREDAAAVAYGRFERKLPG
jgi:hypothetical protein